MAWNYLNSDQIPVYMREHYWFSVKSLRSVSLGLCHQALWAACQSGPVGHLSLPPRQCGTEVWNPAGNCRPDTTADCAEFWLGNTWGENHIAWNAPATVKNI